MTYSGFNNMTLIRKNPLSHQKINGTCDFEIVPDDNLKIEIPINKLTSATYNKDNKVNKLVTVFALDPAIKTNCKCWYRDRANASYKTLYTLTCNLLTIIIIPRNSYT